MGIARRYPLPESPTRNSLYAQPSGEEHDGGGVEEGDGGVDGSLEVLGEAAVAVEPGEGSLDDPASGQDLEADLMGDLLDDVDGDRGGIFDPVGIVGTVGEGDFDEGKTGPRRLQRPS